MKKLYCLLFIIAFLTFAACGRNRRDYLTGYVPANDVPIRDANKYNEPYTHVSGNEYEHIPELESLLDEVILPPHPNAGFISDVEYMLYVLENNFALFDVAYWGRGVDIYAIIDEVIDKLLASEPIGVYAFDRILFEAFRPLFAIGHFHFGERLVPVTPITDEQAQEDDYDDALRELAEQLISDEFFAQAFIREESFFFGQDILDVIQTAIASGNVDEVVYMLEFIFELEPYGGANVSTQIIEAGRIAYLSLLCFMYIPEAEIAQIGDFYKQIYNFEHLIIDLRGNLGGWLTWFYDLILNPLRPGNETITIDSYFLTLFGEHTRRMIRLPLSFDNLFMMPHGFYLVDTELRPLADILEDSCLPLLHPATSGRNLYGFRVQARIDCSPFYLTVFEDIDVTFIGHIWLLIDEEMFSAAHVSAWVAKESGFATLVGNATGGAFGGSPRYRVRLPYSGKPFYMDFFNVLDSRGYAIEAGIVPHHFNRPGMDALATTLALIAEGQY